MNIKKSVFLLVACLVCIVFCSCNSVCKTCNNSGRMDCTFERCHNGIIGLNCTKCNDGAYVSMCNDCERTGSQTLKCKTCKGKGMINKEVKCDKCYGAGQAAYECTRCKGHGFICHKCESEGIKGKKVKTYAYQVKCEVCSGNGFMECTECDTPMQ